MDYLKETENWINRKKNELTFFIDKECDDSQVDAQNMIKGCTLLQSYLRKNQELDIFIKGITTGGASGKSWDLYKRASRLQDLISSELISRLLEEFSTWSENY